MNPEKPDDSRGPLRRFARPSREGRAESDPAFCRNLQARGPGGPPAAGAYWCLKTLRSDGPDGLRAQPEECTDERSCFEPAAVEGEG